MNSTACTAIAVDSRWLNLAAEAFGAKVLYATDDFFAEKENLIKPAPAVFLPEEYTERGKWMDGWESRRKRGPGHDYAIIKLGLPGTIHGFNIDTSFFTGNHPPAAAVEACFAPGETDIKALELCQWQQLLPKSELGPGQHNLFEVQNDGVFTHVRLQIFPDGGVARFRVYGRGDRSVILGRDDEVDLAAAVHGGIVTSCNDMYFSPKDNLIMPHPSRGMHDGWETRRRREPGNDWTIISLGAPGIIQRVELDTAFFKGNYPDRFSLEGLRTDHDRPGPEAAWQGILGEQTLLPDHLHCYDGPQIESVGVVTHVRLSIYPDGGVARLRCFGLVRDSM